MTDTAPDLTTAGRGWARFGFGVGVAATVAANVAHSYVAPDDVTEDWHPPAGAVIAAAFWPLALLISTEVLQRVIWPRGWHWATARWGGMLTVAGIAAVISYRHLSGLMTAYGEDGLSATIGPLAVDGLMVVCSVALLAMSSRRRVPATEAPVIAEPVPVIAPVVSAPALPAVDTRPTVTAKVKTPPKKSGGSNKERGMEMARQGASVEEIQQALGVSERSAFRYHAAAKST